MILGVLVGLTVLHLSVAGTVPSGGDPGNWLAMAHQRLGFDVLTEGVTYPPVFPLLLSVLVAGTDHIPAVVVASLVARSAAVLSVYLILRSTSRVAALLAAGVSGIAAFQLEAYAWGAYPQILGAGLALIATHFLLRFIKHLQRRDVLVGLIASAGVVLTHTLVAALFVVVLPLACIHASWVSEDVRRHWRQALYVIVPTLTFFGIYFVTNAVGDGRALLNPTSLSLVEGIRLSVGESPISWLLITLVAATALLYRQWDDDAFLAVSLGFAWSLAGSGLFLVTAERRCLLQAQVGVLILATTAVVRLLRRLRRRQAASAFVWVVTVAVLGSVAIPGVAAYATATAFYRIVEPSEILALEAMEAASNVGDIVLASRGRNTIPIGWWSEGAARLPTLSGHDTRYLSFPAEIEEAEAASRFFQGGMDPEDSLEYLDELDVRFVLVDKRGPDSDWITSNNVARYRVIYDSPTLLVLGVPETG